MANGDNFQDNRTPEGKMFLVGYRKFFVAVLWMALTCFSVVWVLVDIKPSSAQVTLVIWLVSASGLFCSVFVGGNALAKLWASKYGPPKTTANLSQETTQEESTQRIEMVRYDPQEDASWGEYEKKLPAAKPRT